MNMRVNKFPRQSKPHIVYLARAKTWVATYPGRLFIGYGSTPSLAYKELMFFKDRI